MNDDVRYHIRNCERCLRFKQKPEREEMHLIESSYPLEIVHMDFLVIGSKKDPNKEINVLVVTDYFTLYTLRSSFRNDFTNSPHGGHNIV